MTSLLITWIFILSVKSLLRINQIVKVFVMEGLP